VAGYAPDQPKRKPSKLTLVGGFIGGFALVALVLFLWLLWALGHAPGWGN
jgi:uncharacterized protein involved in exopolysaccharide biosynthesis